MECPGQKLDGGVDPVPTDNPRMTVVEIARRIGKGEAAVHGARLRYGIGHVWSPEDDQFVRDHRGMWVSVLAAKLERTVHAVHNRRKVLGMPNTRSNVWILKQIRFVRDRSSMPAREVAERIGTTIHGVHHKRREVGMSERVRYVPWSKTDDENVREWTPKIRAKDIAVMMGRTTVSVHLRQKMRGLTRTHGELKCTYAEVRFIRENPHMSAVAIAERLERSPGAVRAMRFKSGLPRMQEKKPWVEELDIVRKNQHLKRAGLYRLFPGRSQSSVGWAIKKVEKQRQKPEGERLSSGCRGVYVGGRSYRNTARWQKEDRAPAEGPGAGAPQTMTRPTTFREPGCAGGAVDPHQMLKMCLRTGCHACQKSGLGSVGPVHFQVLT